MVQKQQIQNKNISNKNSHDHNDISQLERFNIGFEFDKTIQDVKRDMRIRTIS